MTLLFYYISLLLVSGLIFKNAYTAWKLNSDFTLPICTLIMYYFTLAGALIFPIDEFSGFEGISIGLHYLPIFERLFEVTFNSDYIIAVTYYAAFILVFQYTYLFFIKKIMLKNTTALPINTTLGISLTINPYLVLGLSLGLIAISMFLFRNEIYYAIAHEKSIYLITRSNTNKYYTLHQLANEFCVLIPFIAYTFTISKYNKSSIGTNGKRITIVILLIACFVASLYITFLGNRREILSGIVLCVLLSINQLSNINYKRFSYVIGIALVFFLLNDFFRSTVIPRNLNKMLHLTERNDLQLKEEENFFTSTKYSKFEKSRAVIGSLLFSNELFYAHFSMYGVLHKNIPLTYGTSFVNLAVSVVPRAIYPNRPQDIYSYYATSVKAIPGQNYTLSHVAAWYLNFGALGVLLGAMLLAMLFAFAFYINSIPLLFPNSLFIIFTYLLPFLLCAQLVTFITAGPEAYKSMLLEGVLIPILLVRLCSTKKTTV